VGDPVLWVVSDPQSGALIELGTKRALPRPIANPHLTEEQRGFEGEHSLFIRCAWALLAPNAEHDWSQTPKASESLELLEHLEGLSITDAGLDQSDWKLTLTFETRLRLVVDPMRRPWRLEGGYTVRADRSYWSVSKYGEVSEERP